MKPEPPQQRRHAARPPNNIRYSPESLDAILARPCTIACESPLMARRLRHALYRRQRVIGGHMVIRQVGEDLAVECRPEPVITVMPPPAGVRP